MTANDWTAICDKPRDIRLIVAEMNGTLLDGDSNIPDDFWQLLDELHAKGVEFVPASGRQLATLRSCSPTASTAPMSYMRRTARSALPTTTSSTRTGWSLGHHAYAD